MKAIARVLVLIGAALVAADPAAGQQSTPPPATTTTPKGTPPGRATAPPPSETPQPAVAVAGVRGFVQGFSIVLVQGDLQASAGSDDVPMAARKALTDMRDFLPFKSYKLLDAAWVLCCGHDARRETTMRNMGMRDVRAVKQVLRGGEGLEYEVELTTYRVDGNRIYVAFSLQNQTRPVEDPRSPYVHGDELAELNQKKQTLERELAARRAAGETKTEDFNRIQSELQMVTVKIKELSTRTHPSAAQRGSRPRDEQRPLIDTTFTMDVGETVVVGTSRMKGASRALIALLTAVPPRSGERRE